MLSVTPPGATAVVPPASVPLTSFAAAGVGLTGFGLAIALAAPRVVAAPTAEGVIGTTHVGVLAFLTVAVLGAIHQFGPVVGRRPLRSVVVARASGALMIAAAWMLPTGFAHGPEGLVVAGGLTGLVAVLLAAWNLSAPFASSEGGVPVVGLRLAIGYLVLTVCFGVVYAIDRHTGWFPLLPNRVLAHAHLGLLGWLGLAYVAVAEKLWPMFLLAHRPRSRSGAVAVGAIGVGTLPLALGLLVASRSLAILGGLAVAVGIGAHLTSLASTIRHRRRPLELLHGYVVVSAGFLVLGLVLGAVGGLAELSTLVRMRVVAAEVAALLAWIALAVVGHAHKIVPFISYTALRARGVRTNRQGGPLLFADLFRVLLARMSLLAGSWGFALVVGGILAGTGIAVVTGGWLVAFAGVLVTWNLAAGPLERRRAAAVAAAPGPGPRPPAPTEPKEEVLT
jgi:hypothetical protein